MAGPSLNIFLLTLSSCTLIGLTSILKPYKAKLLNGLEIFHLTILFISSASNLYVSGFANGVGPRAYIYIALVGTSFLVFLGICVGHIWYRVRKSWIGKRPEPPPVREEGEERYPLWRQRARVRAEDEHEDEEREEVTLKIGPATSYTGRRHSLVQLIADCAD